METSYAYVWTFIGATVVVGLGVGFWLQSKLEESNQIVALPSAFSAKEEVEVIHQTTYA
jgi:hypothetical protein